MRAQTVYYVLFTVSRFAGAPISHYCESHVIIAMFLPVAVLGIIGIMVAQAAQLSWLAWLSVGACTLPANWFFRRQMSERKLLLLPTDGVGMGPVRATIPCS